ncbi:hypothetical protein NPIL_14731 [Nephila pilipes]|uniref:Uncharacterized protein n=1 Tax=Nephila pilipes TaxID=299642 RepID=A0A8X6QAZ3_NEPPI|nr:hypothetical protein NPIL_14731 [Nephila pilipes]
MKLIDDFNTIPSLCFLTGAQIVVTIWNRSDIKSSVAQAVNQTIDETASMSATIFARVQNIVRSIRRNITRLPLSIQQDMLFIVERIGHQMFSMSHYLKMSRNYSNGFLDFPMPYWTVYGTVDSKKTEYLIVRDNSRNVFFRYNIACHGCFEEIIKELFPLLTDEIKNDYLKTYRGRQLPSYWTCVLLGIPSKFVELVSLPYQYSPEQLAFRFTLAFASKSGIEYFLERLPREKNKYVLNKNGYAFIHEVCIPDISNISFFIPPRNKEHYGDALYFLLSKLKKEERMWFLQLYPRNLKCFLEYPFLGLFKRYAQIFINSLESTRVVELFQILYIIEVQSRQLFGLDIFNTLWQICPTSHKEFVRNHYNNAPEELRNLKLRMLERINRAES